MDWGPKSLLFLIAILRNIAKGVKSTDDFTIRTGPGEFGKTLMQYINRWTR
jgi:hypothetical protein